MKKFMVVMVGLYMLTGCAHYITNAQFIQKIDEAGYAKITEGKVQHFTAIKERIFDLQWREVSSKDDPKVTIQVANHGDVAYVTDSINNKLITFRQYIFPDGFNKDWDRYYVFDTRDFPDQSNYIAFGKHTRISTGVVNDGIDYTAAIRDEGQTVNYKDTAVEISFKKNEMPPNTHSDWDHYYVDDERRYALFKSIKHASYQLAFITTSGEEVSFDFIPRFYGLQSSLYGSYRGIFYVPLIKKFYMYDFIPTKYMICFDLARAYNSAASSYNEQVTQAAIKALILSAGGSSTTSYVGMSNSTYNGYYSGNNLTAMGTTMHSGYASTYDYSYMAAGTIMLLDSIFKGNATLDQIETAMKFNECGLLD